MKLYWIENKNIAVCVSDYGARILNLRLKTKQLGSLEVVKGYANASDYLSDEHYRGAIIAPLTNRVPKGKVTLGNKDYFLPINEFDNSLHSGGVGVDKYRWEMTHSNLDSVSFALDFEMSSVRLEGRLCLNATYRLLENGLRLDTDICPTSTNFINATNHVYLNLNGVGENLEGHHFAFEQAEQYLVDEHQLPTGETIERQQGEIYQQGVGFSDHSFKSTLDHHFHLSAPVGSTLRKLIGVYSSQAKLALEVMSNSRGFQCYIEKPKDSRDNAFCIEPQAFIGEPKRLAHADSLFHAKQSFNQRIEWRFSEGT